MNDFKDEFEKNGVVVIPQVFTQDEVNKMKGEGIASLACTHDHPRVKIQYKTKGDVEFPALSFWPALTMSYLDQMRKDKRLSDIAKFFLGDDIKQLNNQFYFRLPGDGDEFAWHQDIFFRDNDEEFPGIADNYIQTAIILDDVTEDSGGVEYVLGSHKQGRIPLLEHNADAPKKLRQFVRGDYQGVKLLAKAGDVVCWSVMIIHGSEQNRSKNSRMVYMNGFAAEKSSKYFPYYMRDGNIINQIDTNLFPENQKK